MGLEWPNTPNSLKINLDTWAFYARPTCLRTFFFKEANVALFVDPILSHERGDKKKQVEFFNQKTQLVTHFIISLH
jgi:hypothetical protein